MIFLSLEALFQRSILIPGPGSVEHTSNGTIDAFLLKLDSDGNHIWSRTFGGEGWEYGYGIDTDVSGNIFLTGEFIGTVNFDPTNPDDLHSSSPGSNAIYILKYNEAGVFQWVVTEGGNGNNFGTELFVSSTGNVIVAGIFSGEMDVDPSPEVVTLTSNGAEDAFCQVLNTHGALINSFSWGGEGGDGAINMAINSAENIFFAGLFQGTVDFNPFTSTFDLSADGVIDIFITRLSGVLSIQKNVTIPTVDFYPNPTTGYVTITNTNPYSNLLEIYSSTGQLVLKKLIPKGNNTLDLNHLDNGIYLLRLEDQAGRLIKK